MKRTELAQSRRHVLIYDEDWEWLHANFGPHSTKPLGVGAAIRELVHHHVKGLRRKVEARLEQDRTGDELNSRRPL